METLGARLRAATSDTGSFVAYETHIVRASQTPVANEAADPLNGPVPPGIEREVTPIHHALKTAVNKSANHLPSTPQADTPVNDRYKSKHGLADVVDFNKAGRRLRPGWSFDWFES